MTSINIHRLLKLEYFLLLAILGLAFYIAFIPHLNYPYPLHVDEWVHLARSQAMAQAGSTSIIDPFFGQGTFALSTNLEAGFQIFWGVFQTISGISWMVIFRYFPSIIFMFTALSVFIMARREGYGLEAALLTCLIPTTVGILGPGLLVPLSTGLLFTPLILFLAFNYRTVWSYLLIFVFISFLLAIHAPSAISPIIILTPYILLNLRGNFKHSIGITLAFILPFLLVFPWILALLVPTAKTLLSASTVTDYVQLPKIIQLYGYLPILLTLLGTLLLAIKGGNRNYGLPLGLLALLAMLVTFFTFHYGLPIMYERGLMYLMLMLSIIAGAGLMGVKNLKLPARFNSWLKVPLITRNVGRFSFLAIVIVLLVISIPNRLDIPYYHMIDDEDYQSFIWIRDNINENQGKALLDPWKATAFTAITGKYIYSRIHAAPKPSDLEAYEFLKSGSLDTDFLVENGISIVYTRVYDMTQTSNIDYAADNPDLTEVAKNIYILEINEKPD